MQKHWVWCNSKYIPDYLRESFSRIRLMSHSLKIETGRWSRLPREERVCICNNESMQTEIHVLIECRLTQGIRLRYPMLDFQDLSRLFCATDHTLLLCKYVWHFKLLCITWLACNLEFIIFSFSRSTAFKFWSKLCLCLYL